MEKLVMTVEMKEGNVMDSVVVEYAGMLFVCITDVLMHLLVVKSVKVALENLKKFLGE